MCPVFPQKINVILKIISKLVLAHGAQTLSKSRNDFSSFRIMVIIIHKIDSWSIEECFS